MNNLFDRFRHRLLIEAIGKSALMGGLIASSIELAFLIVMHLIARNPGFLWIGIVFGVPFGVVFGLFLGVVYYPTEKRVAERIDATGLQERAGTMLQFRDQNSSIIEMQRNDATQRIQQIETKKIRFAFAPKMIVACAVMMALSISCMFVPYSIFAQDDLVANDERSEWIEKLLEELRDKVENADVSEDIKDRLDGVLEDLEEDLNNAGSELEQVGDINKAESKIEAILKEYLTKYSIGAALKKFETTKELGEAIEKGDTEGVSVALDNMENKILSYANKEQAVYLDTIASDIAKALEISGASATNSLYIALDVFSKTLSSIADKVESGNDATDDIRKAISKAETDILSALDEQAKIEDLLKDLEGTLEDAKNEVLGTEGESQEGEEGEQGDKGEGDNPEGVKPGEGEEGELPGGSKPGDGEPGEGDTDSSTMTEGIYDPSSGNVQYGEVFAAYYAEYLASLKEGEIPEDIQTILKRYFDSLNK